MRLTRNRFLLGLGGVAFLQFATLAAEVTPTTWLKVVAGDFDREECVTSVRLPAAYRDCTHVQAAGGLAIPLQAAENGAHYFVLPRQPKGTTQFYEFKRLPVEGPGATNCVEAKVEPSTLTVSIAGRGKVFAYRTDPRPLPRPDIKPLFHRAGYLHPVWSPSGLALTDDYPTNHFHHHGIWFSWTKTLFEGREPNFWEMGYGTGSVEPAGHGPLTSGPVWAGFQATHRYLDKLAKPAKPALIESWQLRVFNVGTPPQSPASPGAPGASAAGPAIPPYYLFDLVCTQACAGASPLTLKEYRYGGLGLRGNWLWNGKDRARFLTSEGETDRLKGNATRARWCYMGGTLEDRETGMATLCHPDNLNAPQPLRLHPDEPFVGYAPTVLGDFSIQPDRPYVSRYRFVLFDGPPNKALLDRLWNDYAHPPEASVVPR